MIAGTLAVLAILLTGGGGGLAVVVTPEHFEERLEQAITEPARSESAVAEWKALQKDLENYAKQIEGLQERIFKADDARTAGAARIDSMLVGFDPTRKSAQQRTFDRLLAIRGAMTREEWARLLQAPEGTEGK